MAPTYKPLGISNTGIPSNIQAILNENFVDYADSQKEQGAIRNQQLVNQANQMKLEEAKRAEEYEQQRIAELKAAYGEEGADATDPNLAVNTILKSSLSQGDADTAVKMIQLQAILDETADKQDTRALTREKNRQALKDLQDPTWRFTNPGSASTDGTAPVGNLPGGDPSKDIPPPVVAAKRPTSGLNPEELTPDQIYNKRYQEAFIATRGDDAAARQAARQEVEGYYAKRKSDLSEVDKIVQSANNLEAMGNKALEGMRIATQDDNLQDGTGNWLIRNWNKLAARLPFGEDNEKIVSGYKQLDSLKPDILRSEFVRGTGALSDRESQAYFEKSTSSENLPAENERLTAKIFQAAQWQEEYAQAKRKYIYDHGSSIGFDDAWNTYKRANPLIVFDQSQADYVANQDRVPFDQFDLKEAVDKGFDKIPKASLEGKNSSDSKIGTIYNDPSLGQGRVLRRIR